MRVLQAIYCSSLFPFFPFPRPRRSSLSYLERLPSETSLSKVLDSGLILLRILPFLRPIFADAVVDAIGLHVDAKRYLCHAEDGYYAALSSASRASLVLQGGVMDAPAAAQFLRKPHAARAIALRRYDDAAKQVGANTPDFDYFVPRLVAISR